MHSLFHARSPGERINIFMLLMFPLRSKLPLHYLEICQQRGGEGGNWGPAAVKTVPLWAVSQAQAQPCKKVFEEDVCLRLLDPKRRFLSFLSGRRTLKYLSSSHPEPKHWGSFFRVSNNGGVASRAFLLFKSKYNGFYLHWAHWGPRLSDL